MRTLKAFLHDEDGATAIEYGLIAAVLSLSIVAGIGKVQDAIAYLFSEPTSAVQQTLN
ncbi:Flp family type IVb pilin [Aquibium sp. LZ166]|uniref:Flp family type IVb pilin n=1 Tax=Aquibium pacificus TaxID=3153579 RepID=A0ABV3SI67_9HYPH